ncbi:MAG: electron transport complex subunit RsxC [Candidatus Fermentibacteraceae bacterium]|nr:electron transport complex subunit RsxC [Candidatus Fermentibacteraceae bacterium]MBN2609719.1 electron transport complex subunit RsxC [Candidatus Fermentibacteraceae bacterium]
MPDLTRKPRRLMAKVRTFRGGTHPPGHKNLSSGQPIRRIPAPELVIVPLCQHLGAPSKPVVSRGDRILRGQEIGAQAGFISLPTHSPVNGTVKSIENVPMPHRRTGPAVLIETESEDGGQVFEPWDDFRAHSREELIERVKLAGVCGMGGASFPTYVKLSPPPGKCIDTLILNGVECEPYLTADHRLMLENPDDVILGMEMLAYALGVSDYMIGIEVNKPDAIKLMEAKGCRVLPLMVSYPQGAEKQLIDAAVGREVPAGGLPMDIGVVVQNVGTAAAVTKAVRDGEPSLRRIITVTGGGVVSPGNYDACTGTLFSRLIEESGGYSDEVVRLISGGPMMGISLYTDEVPVTKGTSGVLALTGAEARDVEEGPCIRCGKCVDACPLRLTPNLIALAAENQRWGMAEEYGALNCMACGTCSYVCPSGRYLVHYIKKAQDAIRANRGKEA